MTYRVRPVKGKFGGSHKPMTVQVDRMKPFKAQDPIIMPPPNFTGEVLDADPHVEEYIHVPSKVSNDIKRENNKLYKDIIEDLYSKQIPPWESHLPDSTLTSREEEKVIENPKKISLKEYKPGPPRPVHKKYAGLPAPALTRARACAQAESSTVLATMSPEPPIEDSYLVDRHTSGFVEYWDDFFHRRLESDLIHVQSLDLTLIFSSHSCTHYFQVGKPGPSRCSLPSTESCMETIVIPSLILGPYKYSRLLKNAVNKNRLSLA